MTFDTGNQFSGRSAPDAEVKAPSVCPACRSASISTTAKSPDVNSYWRCGSCGEIWNVGRRGSVRSGGGNPWR